MNANKNSTITIAICLIAILVFSPVAGFAQAAITFSGEAVALRASAAGISLALSDTGPLPASDGNLKTSVGSVSVLGLVSADVLSSATSGSGTSGRSQSSVANLSLLGGLVAADLVKSNSSPAIPNLLTWSPRGNQCSPPTRTSPSRCPAASASSSTSRRVRRAEIQER